MQRYVFVMFGLLLGTPGCARSSMGAAPAYEAVYEAEYDDRSAGFSGADATSVAATPNMAESVELKNSPMQAARRPRRMRRIAAKRAAADHDAAEGSAPAAPPEPPATTPVGTEVADEGPPDHARLIVYTASMQISVFNLDDAMAQTEPLTNRYGGYVQTMAGNRFVLRIPSVNLRQAMDTLGTLGVVEARTLDAQDITDEFLDIETRIAVLEATQTQMIELLKKARTVDEALKVRQALDQITMELEVLKGRLRRLSDLVSLSTLTLVLIERGPHNTNPSSNDPFPWVDRLGVEATEWK